MKTNLKYILVMILAVTLVSCSIEHHLSKAQKHIDIAKRKGAVIKPDTVWHYSYTLDTVWNVENNSFETRHVRVDSFPYTVTNTISAGMTRQERLLMESYFKHMEKMMKLQNDSLAKVLKVEVKKNRQNKKTEKVIARQKSMPWKMLILYAIIALAIFILIRFKFFIK
jgi:glutamyl-tRNA reductase